jgi:hypothetical protein
MKKNHYYFVLGLVAAVFILSGQALAYKVSGNVNNPGEYSTSGSLWNVLQGSDAGSFPQTAPYQYPCYSEHNAPCITLPQPPYDENTINHNTVDSNYVLVIGMDGSSALFAVGELDPKFAPPGYTATLMCDGRGRCNLTGEGRTVNGVCNINVAQAVPSIHLNGKTFPFTHFYSPLIIVSGDGITPKSYNLTQLQAMQQETFNASSSGTNTAGVWTGPTLASVLEASGVDTSDMNNYIVVQATDGYAAVLSMYEATHMPGAQYALLAISDTLNHTLNNGSCSAPGSATTTCNDSGVARLVLPNDLVAGRWVSNVAQIVVYKLSPWEIGWFPLQQ